MKPSKSYQLLSADKLDNLCNQLLEDLVHPLVLFIGDLGAGKTTIIKRLIQKKGSVDSGSSPSYAIINEYKSDQGPVYHIDLYRLNTVEEVFQLGFEDIIYSGRPCYVEWPQIVLDYLEEPYHVVKIDVKEKAVREISVYDC